MSDLLKDRLNTHSNSFEGLLSLIPAKYYYDDETSNQWKKVDPEQRKQDSKSHRQAKFDHDSGSSALDEMKKREQVVVYDDFGNPISTEEEEESVAAILAAKRQGGNTDENLSKANEAKPKEPKAKAAKEPTKPKAKQPAESKPKQNAEGNKRRNSDLDAPKLAANSLKQESAADKPGIEELRKRLADRVKELKAKRKAPGTEEGSFKNREELLAARKRKLELKKKRKTGEDPSAAEANKSESILLSENEDENESEIKESSAPQIPEDVMFGKIVFKDGSRLSNDATKVEEARKAKKRNAADQLRVLEQRKQKFSELDEDKQKQIQENAKWSRAILQTEGAKLRDDEKLLKKTLKRKANKKLKSEKLWKERMYNTKKGISDREAKRNFNIQAHKEAKRLHLKGKKRKMHMKRAAASLNGK